MVAGDDDLRETHGIQEFPRRLKLFSARPLREIAGYGNDVWLNPFEQAQQRQDDLLSNSAEVKIGKMNQGTHGLITGRSPPGLEAQ
jgi:hypothetical protein